MFPIPDIVEQIPLSLKGTTIATIMSIKPGVRVFAVAVVSIYTRYLPRSSVWYMGIISIYSQKSNCSKIKAEF